MTKEIVVSVNITSLTTNISFSNVDLETATSLRVMLGAYSNELQYVANGVSLPWHDFLKSLLDVSKLLRLHSSGLRFADAYAESLVRNYVDDKNSLKSDKDYVSLDVNDIQGVLNLEGFSRKITLQQQRDIKKLLGMRQGANFSVPGAGKTTTILAVHTILKKLGHVDVLFVISPLNAFISWEDEISDIYNQKRLDVLRLRAEDMRNFHVIVEKSPAVLLVNYEKMRKDIEQIFPYFFEHKVHLVLDESHRIKGGTENISYAQIIRLANIARRRDILSGTPMPQSYKDLIPQFEFLWPVPVVPQIQNGRTDADIAVAISKSIAPLFVRTTKQELDIRKPQIEYISVNMGPIQKALYDLFRSEAARRVSGMDRRSRSYFRSIGQSSIRLLQAASNPMLLGTDNEYYDETMEIPADSEAWELLGEFARFEKSAKIEKLLERVKLIIERDPKNKVVIWTSFVKNIGLLERLLNQYNPVSIHGRVPTGSEEDEQTREGKIKTFHNNSDCRIMIANPQACGEGISLHKVCHYAIYLDRTFNAAHFLQSIDRINRLGLEKTQVTNVEILITKDTIDHLLVERLNQKVTTMGTILDDPYLLELAYDPSDMPPGDYIESIGLDDQDTLMIQQHLEEKE